MEEDSGLKKRDREYRYLNSDEINYLQYIFGKMKKNKDDSVSIQSFKRFLNLNHNKEISNGLLDIFHSYGSSITEKDFLDAMNCDMSMFKSKEKIKNLFDILDSNNKGYITYKNFVNSAKEFDDEFEEETLKQIFDIIDLGNSNKIIYDEFKGAISNM